MPLKVLFTINNRQTLSSSKMLLAFAFPSAQPESSNKTPKYCTRHCAKGFSHIKYELLSMGTSQPFLAPNSPVCFLLFFSWFRLIQMCQHHTNPTCFIVSCRHFIFGNKVFGSDFYQKLFSVTCTEGESSYCFAEGGLDPIDFKSCTTLFFAISVLSLFLIL